MDWKTYVCSWIPGTAANKAYNRKITINRGLDFAKQVSRAEFETFPIPFSKRLGIYRVYREHYLNFETAIRLCEGGKCDYMYTDLLDFADKVCPGLRNVDVIVAACKAVNSER